MLHAFICTYLLLLCFLLLNMPKLKKQRAHLKTSRVKHWQRPAQQAVSSIAINTDDTSSSHLSNQSLMGQPSTSSATSDSDSDFDPNEALKNDPDALLVYWKSLLPIGLALYPEKTFIRSVSFSSTS